MDQISNATAPVAPIKKFFNWKALIAIVLVLALLAGAALAAANLGNSKTAPLRISQKYRNAKEAKLETYFKDSFAGSDGGKVSKLVKLMKKCDAFSDALTDWEDSFADRYENNADEYGSNFKIVLRNDRRFEEKLERDELKERRSSIKELGEDLYELGKVLGKLKNADLKDLAYDLDMSTADLKALIACLKELGQKYRGAEVSDGYTLNVLTKITGSELDDPEEDELDFVVLKVNGKWVFADTFSSLSYLYQIIRTATGDYL